jgi:hypothetical protein
VEHTERVVASALESVRLGGVADDLYRKLGWTEVGRIPDFALKSGEGSAATVVFWRRIVGPCVGRHAPSALLTMTWVDSLLTTSS